MDLPNGWEILDSGLRLIACAGEGGPADSERGEAELPANRG